MSGKWFPQKRRDGRREKEEDRKAGEWKENWKKKGEAEEEHKEEKKKENECKVRRENFKRMRKKVELGSLNREVPYYCF